MPVSAGVSVSIKSGENIGICGRTGAGKSTLLSVLFSLGPLRSGSVSIAGVDLATISCHEVRANVAIVPQSPTLFDGTVRENLVGGNRNAEGDTDEYLLETLRTCRLSVLVERGLDGSIGQLSDGQRQLFCVARALVRKPKILVLDESTADLDQDSANELLRVIDENFKTTTVISIAHRLNFIRASDKILGVKTPSSFCVCFPMLVPSLSWQNDGVYIVVYINCSKMGRFVFRSAQHWRHSQRIWCGQRLFLSFPYVCPEPVLAK
jgi:ABC-type multidrug transport system fused ATPase/permease subunit